MALISLECCSTLASFNHFFLENPQVTKASLDKQNKAKMKLFNVDASEQDNLIGTGDEDDVGSAGHGEKIISKFKKKGNTNDWNI